MYVCACQVATRAALHAHRALKHDGMLFLVEPMAAAHDSVVEQLDIPGAASLSAISCHVFASVIGGSTDAVPAPGTQTI